MTRRTWDDSMFDGATFIGPLMRLTGGDEPPEFYWANYWHDRNYVEQVDPVTGKPITRAEADAAFFNHMKIVAESCSEPRRTLLMRKARTRYAAVRLAGWWFWNT